MSQTNKRPFDELLPEDVHVWVAHLETVRPEDYAAFQDCLDEAEAARARRFHFERDRRHFTVARGWLRRLLSQYLEVPGEEIGFAYGARGKPRVHSPATDLRFNLSHSHGRAMFAFAWGREVGIDLEAGTRLGEDWRPLARRIFTPREQAELTALPDARQRQGFLNGWTRKEAYLKATGLGIVDGLQSIDVTLAPGTKAELLAGPAGLDWTVHDLRSDEDFAAALIVESRQVSAVTYHDCATCP